MRSRSGLTLLGVGTGLVSLAGASVVWACSSLAPSAYVTSNPTEAVEGNGTTATVTTHNMSVIKDTGTTRIIWADGSNNYLADLGVAPDGDSTSVSVSIPMGTAGYYYIGVYRGSFRGTPTTFTVDAKPGEVMPPKPIDYGTPDTRSFSLGGRAATAPAPGAGTLAPGGTTATQPQPVAQGQAPAQGQTQAQAQGQAQQAPASSDAASPAVAAQTAGVAAKVKIFASPASAPAVPDSPTSATPIQGAPQQPARGGNAPAGQVLGNLWGGFAHGQTTSTPPSLIRDAGSVPALGLTVGLLAAGLVALFAGFGLAEVRRSRVKVSTNNS